MEDLTYGQRIRNYTIEVSRLTIYQSSDNYNIAIKRKKVSLLDPRPVSHTSRAAWFKLTGWLIIGQAKLADGSWTGVSHGQSVGHKRIDIFEQPVEASALRLTVLENQASPVYIRFLGGFAPLPPPPPPPSAAGGLWEGSGTFNLAARGAPES
jgi:hypothetical protein